MRDTQRLAQQLDGFERQILLGTNVPDAKDDKLVLALGIPHRVSLDVRADQLALDGDVAEGDLMDLVDDAACLGRLPVYVLAVVEELVGVVADADPAALSLHRGRDGDTITIGLVGDRQGS